MEPYVKPKDEVHLGFAGLLSDEFSKYSLKLVAKNKRNF